MFKLDGRHVDDGDAHVITDLNFGEGDQLLFRFFDAGTFDDFLDPGNSMPVASSGGTATMDSLDDIVEAHLNGVMQASDSGDGDTLLTISSAGNQMTVELDGVAFSSLNIPVGPVDLSPTDDVLIGWLGDDTMNGYGGDDRITFRIGDDTATGGTGADSFILDGRKLFDGESHTITDLNFGEGDNLQFRFMDIGTFDDALDPVNDLFVYNSGRVSTFDSVEDILETHANGVITAADDGFGGTVLSITVAGNALTLTLDGLDVI